MIKKEMMTKKKNKKKKKMKNKNIPNDLFIIKLVVLKS